jgi:5-methylcytosine-specific restriction endonuclease McrA
VKRSSLARKTPLARGTATLTRTAIKPGKRKTRQKMPPGVAAEVKRLSRGRCVRCGTRRGLQRHHVLPVAIFAEYETEALCMVLACAGCHDEHERAHRRLRMAELPPRVLAWAMSRGGRESLYVQRTYPR